MDHLEQLEIECRFVARCSRVKLPGGMNVGLGTPPFVKHVAKCFQGRRWCLRTSERSNPPLLRLKARRAVAARKGSPYRWVGPNLRPAFALRSLEFASILSDGFGLLASSLLVHEFPKR